MSISVTHCYEVLEGDNAVDGKPEYEQSNELLTFAAGARFKVFENLKPPGAALLVHRDLRAT